MTPDTTATALADAVTQIAHESALHAPPTEPSSAPVTFQDIDGFATGAELAAVASDPTKLGQFLSQRWEEKGRIGSLLRQKAEYLDMIRNNPEMVEAITNIAQGKPANGAAPQKLQQSDEIAALRQEIQGLKQGLSQRDQIQEEVRQFAAQNPDFVRLVPTMQKLQQERPYLKIRDLYELAKANSGNQSSPSTPSAVSERPSAGIAPDRTMNPELTKLQTRLRDRNIPFDTALEEAVQFAMRG